jgi:hypothetical protein
LEDLAREMCGRVKGPYDQPCGDCLNAAANTFATFSARMAPYIKRMTTERFCEAVREAGRSKLN